MALKKVKRPVLVGEEKVEEAVVAPAVEEKAETAVQEPVKAEETKVEAKPEAETPVAEETKEEAKPKASTKKATTKKESKPKATAKPKAVKKEEPAEDVTEEEVKPKATTKKGNKTVSLRAPKESKPKKEEKEGNRATKKKVMRLTQEALEAEGLTITLEDLTTIINSFEEVVGEVTNKQSYKFMNGMIQVQERSGQVFKSPKVDYYSYKAPRTVKTFTQDTENVDKYRGQYDADTKVFKAEGKWNYDTKEFEEVDLEIVVGDDDSK